MVCSELNGDSYDIFFIEKASIQCIETSDKGDLSVVWRGGQPSPVASEQADKRKRILMSPLTF